MNACSKLPATIAAFEETADRFVASRLPEILSDLATILHTAKPGIVRCALLASTGDGTSLRYGVDGAGRRFDYPEELRAVTSGTLLDRARTEPDRVLIPAIDDPCLAWCTDDPLYPLMVVAVRGTTEYYGYLVLVEQSSHKSQTRRNTARTRALPPWAGLAASVVGSGIRTIRILVGAVRFARDFTLMRDRETGEHQLRLGAYLQLLAREMQSAGDLPEGLMREVTLFGPLHDIGKIGISDDVLLKPGRFDAAEWAAMKRHVDKGCTLVRHMSHDLALDGMPGLDTLTSVVAHHHEYLDGSGYPEGRSAADIPLAARMVTVVDIFDALTCVRPYKRSWGVDEAFTHLQGLADDKIIDRDCFRAMRSVREGMRKIWWGFHPQAAT